jgi:hypothetical protein
LLGIAGNLYAVDCQVACPLEVGRGDGLERRRDAMENVPVRGADIIQARRGMVIEYKAEAEAARTKQHRPAPAGPAQDGHAIGFARRDVHVNRHRPPRAEHDRQCRQFPEAQDLARAGFLGSDEERLVEREVLGRIRKPEVESAHGGRSVMDG